MGKSSVTIGLLVALLFPVKSLFAGDSCFDGEEPGSCILLKNCEPLMLEIRKAGNRIPFHLRKKLQNIGCGFEGDEQLVCCAAASGFNNDINPGFDDTNWGMKPKPTAALPFSWTMDVTPTQPPERTDKNPIIKRSGEPPDVQNHPNLNLLSKDCGIVDSDRIFGGNRTRLFEMPWMVLLSYNSPRGTKLSCGGTLISERYVLTAAHCVSFLGERLQLNGVILGEHDVRKDPDCERIQEKQFCAPSVRNVSIETVTAHPGYSPETLVDDIALLRLAEPADFNIESMKAVCLPMTPELQNQWLEGQPGTVAGWGATEDGLQSPVLLSVELPIVSKTECMKVYKDTPQIHDRQLCAGGVQDKDSCGGDSGGPLMYPGNVGNRGERLVQRGIVSFGSKRCGIGGFPGVYTRVAYYMDWILDNMHE